MPEPRSAATPHSLRVSVIAPPALGSTAIALLSARDIAAQTSETPHGHDVVAWALDKAPPPSAVADLAAICQQCAEAGRPLCLFVPSPPLTGRAAIERAASLAFLRSYGAAITSDVDAWIEAIVVIVRHGMPAGPRVAIIAPPSSWLFAQATTIASEAVGLGLRPPTLGQSDEPADVILYDAETDGRLHRVPALYVPVAARGELATDRAALHGARAALGAMDALGKTAERIAVGLGPAPSAASAELAVDRERMARQLMKLQSSPRWGDHETKVLLAAYGTPITRQAVAMTPSAAVKLARRAGFPVELKPWGHDLPTEPAGCPVETQLTSDALVRAAFATVLAAAGRLLSRNDNAAVIVRETPPAGREVAASFVKLPSVGWTVIAVAGGSPMAAAPAPLRLLDAQRLAGVVVASRSGEPDPDRAGLANILRRVSHLVVDLDDRLRRLELPRIVVGARGARSLVVDAFAEAIGP